MDAPSRSYKDLVVWQKAIELVAAIYSITDNFPEREKYALATQMRRASVSIPSNIAEGRSRSTRKDFINFLYIALGSSTELETQLIIAEKLHYISHHQFTKAADALSEICRMLHAIIRKLEAGAQQSRSSRS